MERSAPWSGILLIFFAAGCSAQAARLRDLFSPPEPRATYEFSMPQKEKQRIKEKIYAETLYRPHPLEEARLIANLPKRAKPQEKSGRESYVSEKGFPLVSFKGGPTTLGKALRLVAGSAGYYVEWGEGINKALPVNIELADVALDKAVAALIEPFGYRAAVDGEKGVISVSLKGEKIDP